MLLLGAIKLESAEALQTFKSDLEESTQDGDSARVLNIPVLTNQVCQCSKIKSKQVSQFYKLGHIDIGL